jgi:hypothetical protein
VDARITSSGAAGQSYSYRRSLIKTTFYGGTEQKILDIFVANLRKKLAQATGGSHYIETAWGRGYALRDPTPTPPPEPADAREPPEPPRSHAAATRTAPRPRRRGFSNR